MVSAATVGLFGAALNVLRIYDDAVDDDQQRLIPEELRYVKEQTKNALFEFLTKSFFSV